MKIKYLLLLLIIIIIANSVSAQNWKNYKGKLTLPDETHQIELKILHLNDGVIIGSYRQIGTNKQYKLVGEINNNSVKFAVKLSVNYELIGFINGKFDNQLKTFTGVLIDVSGLEVGKFEIMHDLGEPYTDIINEHRKLFEYKSFDEALLNATKVKSIDVTRQKLVSVPDIFDRFPNLVSINLLGNNISKFPIELTKTNSIKELSLSSNGLKTVGSEIGKLTELRILIMNFNLIVEIPKEIGNLTELLYLDLGDNLIIRFPDEIGNLKKLQELHVDDNLLSDEEKLRLQKLLPNCDIHFGYKKKEPGDKEKPTKLGKANDNR